MDLKSRLQHARQKLRRRDSQTSTSARSLASSAGSDRGRRSSLPRSMSLTKLPAVSSESIATCDDDAAAARLSQSAVLPPTKMSEMSAAGGSIGADKLKRADGSSPSPSHSHAPSSDRPSQHMSIANSLGSTSAADSPAPAPASASDEKKAVAAATIPPQLTLEEPTPIRIPANPDGLAQQQQPRPPPSEPRKNSPEPAIDFDEPSDLRPSPPVRVPSKPSPPGVFRRQSLVTNSNARIIKTLLEPDQPHASVTGPPTAAEYFNAGMLHRKIWVKRANASATLVQIREDDLVDDVRDMILKKYANTLGKNFDAPDLTLRIHPRDSTAKGADRLLGPEEEMCRTLDAYYPGGQTVDEALLIDVPRRTPKPSPRVPVYYSHHEETRPYENASEYFPPMPIVNPSPVAMTNNPYVNVPQGTHSIAVLQTGQLPNLPSPGGTRRGYHPRPKYPRHTTASPTTLTSSVPNSAVSVRPPQRTRHDSTASETKHSTSSGNAPIPTPPAAPVVGSRQNSPSSATRVDSPRPEKKRKKAKVTEHLGLPAGLLDNSVPPINVLIVEDNIINLRVLGAFMQRLKVRWQRAMNGKEAVTKWRAGGFHLVLMDIQLPIMNGLEATKEIRRLERVNNIGVFSSGSSEAPNNRLGDDGNSGKEINDDDKLGDKNLFKSPVIIVALTASSLQSDRHEALAAGCNDFLTKPVNFVWLERKVKEWGCMQALIDFDGWRKWKDFAAAQDDATESTAKASTSYSSYASRPKPSNLSPTSATNGKTIPTTGGGVVFTTKPHEEEKEKKSKRRSLGIVPPPSVPEEESTASAEPGDT